MCYPFSVRGSCKGSGMCKNPRVPAFVQVCGTGLGLEQGPREWVVPGGHLRWGSPEWTVSVGAPAHGTPGRCVVTPPVTCHRVATQPQGFSEGSCHPKLLPVLGTPLSPGSSPGSAAHCVRIRSHCPSFS